MLLTCRVLLTRTTALGRNGIFQVWGSQRTAGVLGASHRKLWETPEIVSRGLRNTMKKHPWSKIKRVKSQEKGKERKKEKRLCGKTNVLQIHSEHYQKLIPNPAKPNKSFLEPLWNSSKYGGKPSIVPARSAWTAPQGDRLLDQGKDPAQRVPGNTCGGTGKKRQFTTYNAYWNNQRWLKPLGGRPVWNSLMDGLS